MKEKNFTGKKGTTIKIIGQMIKRENKKIEKTTTKRRISQDKITKGIMATSDINLVLIGLNVLKEFVRNGLRDNEKNLKLGNEDVGNIRKNIYELNGLISSLVREFTRNIENSVKTKEEIRNIYKRAEILQATRDGILTKTETKKEIVDGKEIETRYDTSFTVREINEIFEEYEREKNDLIEEKLGILLEIGFCFAEIIGMIYRNKQEKEIQSTTNINNIVAFSFMALKGLKVLPEMYITQQREKTYKIDSLARKAKWNILDNEPISDEDQKRTVKEFEKLKKDAEKLMKKKQIIQYAEDGVIELATGIITGAYINSKVSKKENGKLDGKDLAQTLREIQNMKSLGGDILFCIEQIQRNLERSKDFEINKKMANKINRQMEERVYSLEGPTHEIQEISITNITGKFYPKKDYTTGKRDYGIKIKIPEFSIKRGDIVLLSGESGVGKSTFIRFLKRGDYNNRKKITIDKLELVDNIRGQFVSFKPNTKLGEETSVLQQITGKDNMQSLSKREKNRLLNILKKMNFSEEDLLEQLSRKRIIEFSTGQQRRLALAKLFYRIRDGKSMIIVDEPVGNVEDKLIREQLEMIVKFAQKRNVMLILTTHRLDLAIDLATKRYNINKEGILEEIPIVLNETKKISNQER